MEAKRDMMKKVPVREQDPKVRATNFKEVCLGYNMEEAVAESERCLNCKNAKCIAGCPVSINIPAFIQEVKAGNIEEAAKVIALSSALPAVCGRVCPQESQCEGQCVRGIKGEAVSIGKLERFVADWSREHGFVPAAPEKTNGKKVAVIGSGPAGLTCAGDLAKMGYDVTIFEALHESQSSFRSDPVFSRQSGFPILSCRTSSSLQPSFSPLSIRSFTCKNPDRLSFFDLRYSRSSISQKCSVSDSSSSSISHS